MKSKFQFIFFLITILIVSCSPESDKIVEKHSETEPTLNCIKIDTTLNNLIFEGTNINSTLSKSFAIAFGSSSSELFENLGITMSGSSLFPISDSVLVISEQNVKSIVVNFNADSEGQYFDKNLDYPLEISFDKFFGILKDVTLKKQSFHSCFQLKDGVTMSNQGYFIIKTCI